MRGGGRVDDQRARIADIGEVREQLHVGDELDAGVVAALQAEREDRAGAVRAIFLGEVVIAVAGEPRIADPGHARMRRDPFRDRQRIVAVPLHAQRQRLDAVEEEKRIERRQSRADVAQRQHAAGDGKGKVAEGLVQHDAMIFRPRLAQHRITPLARPVEGAAVDDQATDRIAMATKEFGQRMHDDIGAVIDRLAQIRGGERVVDDIGHAGTLGDLRHRLHVGDDAARIGDRLGENRLGLWADGAIERGNILRVRPHHVPAEILEGVIELVDRAAIELLRGDEFVARLHQAMKRQHLRGVTGGDRKPRSAAFERGDAFLEHGSGRVADARIDVAEGLQPKQRCGVIDAFEHVRRGLIDRCRACARCRIGLRAGMDGQRGKSRNAFGHGAPAYPAGLLWAGICDL